MKLVGFDTETHLFRPGRMAPPLVCTSVYDGRRGAVLGRDNGLLWFRQMVDDGETHIVGHNAAYDLSIFLAADFSLGPRIFRMLDEGRVHDTMIRVMLLDIAQGELMLDSSIKLEHATVNRYSLAGVVHHYMGGFDISSGKGADTWRMRYAELENIPTHQWPGEAYSYALADARWPFQVMAVQDKAAAALTETLNKRYHKVWRHPKRRAETRWESVLISSVLANEAAQVQAAMALRLMEVWGVRTDSDYVRALRRQLEGSLDEVNQTLVDHGILVRRYKTKPGTRVSQTALRERMIAAYAKMGLPPPRTAASSKHTEGQVKVDRETCLACGDPVLKVYGESTNTSKLLSTYVPTLEQGTTYPIHCRYNVLVESGRCSCRNPNHQNPPRVGGVRECYVARDGYVFVFCDYDSAETRGLAQVCLDLVGFSHLADRYQADPDFDPHTSFAASMMGISYAEGMALKAAKDVTMKANRQRAKAALFGFPGGLGASTFIQYARGYDVELTLEESEAIRDAWFKEWPEMSKYFRYISKKLIDTNVDGGYALQLRSDRVRGRIHFTQACNTFFQGIVADGTKRAAYQVAKECYTVPESPLYGSRPWLFMHDEIGMESPEGTAHEAAMRLREVMIEALSFFLPEIPVGASPALCRRWYKAAEPVYVNGRLVPWELGDVT